MVVKALLFDVFGTVVDWRSSVVEELQAQAKSKNINLVIDWSKFAQEWRNHYIKATLGFAKALVDGNASHGDFKTVDEVHKEGLIQLNQKYGLDNVWSADEIENLSLIWHKLKGWPDTVPGLLSLKKNYIIATLSNGNNRLLIDMVYIFFTLKKRINTLQ